MRTEQVEVCACGQSLVVCEKCGGSRCLACDPYGASWIDCGEDDDD